MAVKKKIIDLDDVEHVFYSERPNARLSFRICQVILDAALQYNGVWFYFRLILFFLLPFPSIFIHSF